MNPAALALYCLAAEGVGPIEMAPGIAPALPGWIAADHALVGWITGQDALLQGWLNLDSRRVFYGWVIAGADGVTAIIRGTQSFAEWTIDAAFLPRAEHPVQGEVESGFWSLYCTLEFRDTAGADHPLCAGVKTAAGRLGAAVTVTGHSLGAALATYAALELRARGCFIASPHPGNGDFAKGFAARVTDYESYAYAEDLVPKLPVALGYEPLPKLTVIPSNSRVKNTIACCHHAGTYAWLLGGALAPQAATCVTPGDPR